MFEGLKMAADLIKSGIAESKLWSKLDAMAEKAHDEYENIFTARQKELYEEYLQRKAEAEAALGDENKSAAAQTAKEEAEMAFMTLLSKNARLPKDFKEELTALLTELAKSDDRAQEVLEKAMMRYAKTDAEKAEMKKEIEAMKKNAAANK